MWARALSLDASYRYLRRLIIGAMTLFFIITVINAACLGAFFVFKIIMISLYYLLN
jgi:hypothetical protein